MKNLINITVPPETVIESRFREGYDRALVACLERSGELLADCEGDASLAMGYLRAELHIATLPPGVDKPFTIPSTEEDYIPDPEFACSDHVITETGMVRSVLSSRWDPLVGWCYSLVGRDGLVPEDDLRLFTGEVLRF